MLNLIEGPEFPDALNYLWTHFLEILLGVAPNGMVATQVAWCDIQAWAELTGNVLAPWEARTIVILGVKRATILSEKLESSPKTQVSGRS